MRSKIKIIVILGVLAVGVVAILMLTWNRKGNWRDNMREHINDVCRQSLNKMPEATKVVDHVGLCKCMVDELEQRYGAWKLDRNLAWGYRDWHMLGNEQYAPKPDNEIYLLGNQCLPEFLKGSAGGSRVEEIADSKWSRLEQLTYFSACENRIGGSNWYKDLDATKWCNCMLGKLSRQYDYSEINDMPPAKRIEISRECKDGSLFD